MAEYVRVATFEVDDAALDSLVKEIKAGGGPPPELPAKSVMVVANRTGGKARVITRFGSEEDLRKGSEILDAMSPPGDANMRRLSVESFEVLLEEHAP
jgi:hypothetical protein